MKWKCHNCNNEFESEDNSERDESEIHAVECFDIFNFYELIENGSLPTEE